MEKYVYYSKLDFKNIRINYNNTAYYSIFKSIYFYNIGENSTRLFDVYDLEIINFFVDFPPLNAFFPFSKLYFTSNSACFV